MTLEEELAHLDKIEAEAREAFKDPQLTIFDVAAIRDCADRFGVTRQHAYLRAKSLGLLSYQTTQGSEP